MARKRKIDDIVALQVRLPEALRQRLVNEAEQSKRSLNSEILWRLGQTLEQEFQEFIAGVEKRQRNEQEFMARLRANPETRKLLDHLIANMKSNIEKKRGG
jgi:Arc-like DNA binding domain